MQIGEAFPSKYLKASDLQGRNVNVKIDRVDFEIISNDKKLILFFQGKQKGMVLNKTNANNISKLYGSDTDNWSGQDIVLFEAMVDFQGETVPAIRVKGPVKQPAPQRQVGGISDAASDMNDAIPF